MKPSPEKLATSRTAVAIAFFLALTKFLASAYTGSLAILSSAIDSLLDIFMSGVNFLAIRQADQPADKGHPFGHGKFEALATFFQALVILVSGGWILWMAIRRLMAGGSPAHLEGGMAVLLASSAVSWWIGRRLDRVGRKTDSSALRADALHYTMDVFTNLGLVAGLVVVKMMDAPWIDPCLSILIVLYIFREAWRLIRRSLGEILDEELPQSVQAEVAHLIGDNHNHPLGFHRLRTRRAGSQKIMDFHLTVCKHLSVEEAHAITDRLEKQIQKKIQGSDITIHIEPCREERCPGMEACPAEKTRWATPEKAAKDGKGN